MKNESNFWGASNSEARIESKLAATTKGPVEYTWVGEGPVVLHLHGTSSSCFSTATAAPLIAAGFSVLTPSRPGHGRTPLSVGRSASEAAGALVALLDCLGVRTCSVLAISGGGPTGIALAAGFPSRVDRLALAAAITRPEARPAEPGYASQRGFYGPLHRSFWGLLGLMSRLAPRRMALQTLAIFSTHDPQQALNSLSAEDVASICRFYQGSSSRSGALNDATHTVAQDALQSIRQPTLILHSRADRSVPFDHARWALEHIPQAELCESGCTGHFFWLGPDWPRTSARMAAFLRHRIESGGEDTFFRGAKPTVGITR
ncbi:MAG TPA: alpha/beta hydrolase [Anaerolineaceae bacterium]|nr:alpha/beta hydrolase [Anaerolineaceae bacterium]